MMDFYTILPWRWHWVKSSPMLVSILTVPLKFLLLLLDAHVWYNLCIESPKRLINIKKFIDEHPEFEVVEPNDYSLGPILDVHRKDYVDFLETIYQEWVDSGLTKDICIGDTFSQRSFVGKLDDETVRKNASGSCSGKMGYYVGDVSTPFVQSKYIQIAWLPFSWASYITSH